ncbi:Acid-sensing ion channel 2 [Microtus ochrogaster]|uniref:Acid-sensing ion channel 2 n=1 Tax=Microtus ochrogaster TaxID=79684 RepID=A0A8J6KSJ0_MICOH|nr:Acid-sensing ion channel 2 [Microtus ochrogaster]
MDLKESPSEGSLQPSSIQIFANTSTLHGIRHIFVYGPLTIRRVLWAVAFVGSLGLLLVESSERVSYYFSYQHVTKVDEVVAQSLVFPAVTLCNLNGFRFSRLTTNDLYHAGELLALLDVNLQIPDPHLADPTVLEALRQKANFKHYKPKQFSMLEFLHRVGHDLKDMMLYCKFKGQECGHQDFTTAFEIRVFNMGPMMVSKNHYSDLNQASLGLGFTVPGSAGLLLFRVGEGFPSQLLSIRKLFLF